jgi:hypothetical protein
MKPAPVALLILSLAACTEMPMASDAAPQFAKGTGPGAAALTFRDSVGDGIASDGGSATILGVATAASYANGQCGVSATVGTSATNPDMVSDITGLLPRNAPASCGHGRRITITLDRPLLSDGTPGGPAFAAVSAAVHIKLQQLYGVTAATGPSLIDGGFNQLSGVGDCTALRFNSNFGGDRLLATRTRTRGVSSDRNEWTVQTIVDQDRAACLDANSAVRRLYRLPMQLTITQTAY